jgi:hypothetical protein
MITFRPFWGWCIHPLVFFLLLDLEIFVLTISIEELDTLLLLTVQSACNLTGVKVPWEKVAELMGPKFTEGAIVQHLSKLRIRREAAGQRVPPPLRRSVTAAAAAAGGGGKGGLNPGKNSRKRKGRSGIVDDDSSDGLDAQEEEDSDPEYIQNKKKHNIRRFSFPTSKKSNMGLEDDDNDDALMCGGAPFLQHTEPDPETDQYNIDSDDSNDDAEHDLDDDDYDSDAFRAKIKVEQDSPTPRPSRVIKLPVSLRNRGQSAMKSIRGLADATPPPSAMGRRRKQSFLTTDPARMNKDPGSMFVPQGAWNHNPMPTSQASDNPYQTGPLFWPAPTPVVNNRMLPPGDFIWSTHAPAYASGRGGNLAVSGVPPPTWGSDEAIADTTTAPSMAMNPSQLFLNAGVFDQDDENEALGGYNQQQGDEEY